MICHRDAGSPHMPGIYLPDGNRMSDMFGFQNAQPLYVSFGAIVKVKKGGLQFGALTDPNLQIPPQDTDCSDTISPKRVKNLPDSFLAVPAIRRLPNWAILPPTSTLAV
ncbi:hypothetical protein RUE5091_03729 [Ruegeria denitrificans]|uniref:Uncharacterized protein n=1 Tax=Ruegeria denitrificans TaxID=1715692 RepID=A0A0P1IHW9_9RHOB|nr:hypothetical protein RUE5091_03729 [Ruegeria denitrificans]